MAFDSKRAQKCQIFAYGASSECKVIQYEIRECCGTEYKLWATPELQTQPAAVWRPMDFNFNFLKYRRVVLENNQAIAALRIRQVACAALSLPYNCDVNFH